MNNTNDLHQGASGIVLRRVRRVVTACLSLALVAASGAVCAEAILENKILADDASSLDRFGSSVAIRGNMAIVGAPGGMLMVGDAPRNGLAYVFDMVTGDQLFQFVGPDGDAKKGFGHSVGISGNTAIVAATRQVYLYDLTTGMQRFELKLDPPIAGGIGDSVAIDGNIAMVGETNEDDIAATYLFDVTTGEEIGVLRSNAQDDAFGRSVGISGNRAIVGARLGGSAGFNEDPRGGAAYLFDVDPLSPNFGQELFKLSADDADHGDQFGHSVAISGNRAIVGARADRDASKPTGSAYLFDVTTGEQLFKLTASDAAEDDRFGSSVSISGNLAIVGAPGNFACPDVIGCNSGSAYLFDVITGRELAKITASDMADGDFFGFVGIDNGTAIVGAPGDDDLGSATGAAYILTDLPRPIPEPSSLFLATVALVGLLAFPRGLRDATNGRGFMD